MFNNEFDNQATVSARAVSYVLIGIGAAISGMATAAFFYSYAADLFTFISPSLSPWIAAAAGVFLFEFSSFAWSQVEAKHADTSEQITIAAAGKWLALGGSVLTTVVYFALNSSLLAGRLDDTALYVVSIIGGLLVIVGSSGLFLLAALYTSHSASHTKARQNATIRAMQSNANHTINREATAATLSQTVEEIRRRLPENASKKGARQAGEFEAANFADVDKWGPRLIDLARQNGHDSHPTNGR